MEKAVLPIKSPSNGNRYHTTAISVASSWDSVHIKKNLTDTWANIFEPRIPIYDKEAWSEAFSKPTNDMTPEDDSSVSGCCRKPPPSKTKALRRKPLLSKKLPPSKISSKKSSKKKPPNQKPINNPS